MRVMVVAPAMTRRRDEFYHDVMYCVVKRLYIVVDTMDCRRLCRNFNCHSIYCSCMCLYIPWNLFWRLPIWGGNKKRAYIKKSNIFLS
jgi:hypothetical protein